jgi:hypothetical protein
VLYLAAATAAKDRAERHDPMGRACDELHKLTNGVLRFYERDANARAFFGQRTGAKNNQPACAANGLAICKQVGEFNLDLGSGA